MARGDATQFSLSSRLREERGGERRRLIHEGEIAGPQKVAPLPSPLPVRASRGEGKERRQALIIALQVQASPFHRRSPHSAMKQAKAKRKTAG